MRAGIGHSQAICDEGGLEAVLADLHPALAVRARAVAGAGAAGGPPPPAGRGRRGPARGRSDGGRVPPRSPLARRAQEQARGKAQVIPFRCSSFQTTQWWTWGGQMWFLLFSALSEPRRAAALRCHPAATRPAAGQSARGRARGGRGVGACGVTGACAPAVTRARRCPAALPACPLQRCCSGSCPSTREPSLAQVGPAPLSLCRGICPAALSDARASHGGASSRRPPQASSWLASAPQCPPSCPAHAGTLATAQAVVVDWNAILAGGGVTGELYA